MTFIEEQLKYLEEYGEPMFRLSKWEYTDDVVFKAVGIRPDIYNNTSPFNHQKEEYYCIAVQSIYFKGVKTFDDMSPSDKNRWNLGYRPVYLDVNGLVDELSKYFENAPVGSGLMVTTCDMSKPVFVKQGLNLKGFEPITRPTLSIDVSLFSRIRGILLYCDYNFPKNSNIITL